MKAILLAAGENARLHPITRLCARPLLPFLNKPLVTAQVESLRRHGFREVGVAVSSREAGAIEACLGDGTRLGVRITYAVEDIPKGPVGCLKAFQDFVGEDPFLVVNGGVYLGPVDLSGLAEFHATKKAVATLARHPEEAHVRELENTIMTPDGRIRSFTLLHPSKDQRTHRRLAGVCLFDPEILQFIRGDRYTDLKEQLLPDLGNAGFPIYGYPLLGSVSGIDTPWDYYQAQCESLGRGEGGGSDRSQVGKDVWVEPGARISSSAYILGPVVIGKRCVVGDDVRIIGPAVIGDDCRIEQGGLVRESILWGRTRLCEHSRVEYSVLGSDCCVSFGRSVSSSVMMSDLEPLKSLGNQGPKPKGGPIQADISEYDFDSPWGLALKRVLDVVISAAGLVLCAPLFLLIGLAIKLDSRGPVFFLQRRCGKHSREFRMFKFRTMVQNADDLQELYQAQKDMDGPIFKLRSDPRVTRLGKALRKYSLDELPQLVNVLKGQMSLVGPRPLVMEEMRFNPAWRAFRLSVKPGITGLWQVNGRSQGSFHDWIRYDIEYVKRRSLWMDLKILGKTLWVVVKRTGAY